MPPVMAAYSERKLGLTPPPSQIDVSPSGSPAVPSNTFGHEARRHEDPRLGAPVAHRAVTVAGSHPLGRGTRCL